MELKLNEKELFYLQVLLMKELEELDKHDQVNVFRGVKLSFYMSLYDRIQKLSE